MNTFKVTYFDYIINDMVDRIVEAENENEAKVIAWALSPYFERKIKPNDYKVDLYIPPKPKYKSKVDAINRVGENNYEKARKVVNGI